MASLVKQLDELVTANEEKKMAAVVNLVDIDVHEATKFAEAHEFKKVAIATCDQANAERFKVNPEALVTALHYRDKKVVSNQAVAQGKLDEAAIKSIVEGASSLLNDEADEKEEHRDFRRPGE